MAKDGFIAILKQMTITAMLAIEVDRVSGQKTPHDCCDRDRSGTKKKMKMVWDKCPGITNKDRL